jgi:succinoglycan biosynthesis protein ExoW
MIRIGVVIPFFQHEPGILRRTLESVLAQRLQARLLVIVVNDGAPIDVQREIPGALRERAEVRAFEQRNRGAASARNLALDQVDDDCELVALLDSDDIWTPDHLANAAAALVDGAAFYFADCRLLNGANTLFDVAAFIRGGFVRSDAPNRHAYVGRNGFTPYHHLLARGFFQTSTVVFRRSAFTGLRFDPRFRLGQDYLFFLAALATGPQVVFSPIVEAICGRGINVWQHLAGSRSGIRIALEARRQLDWIEERLPLDSGARAIVAERRRMADYQVAYWLYRALREDGIRALLEQLAPAPFAMVLAALRGVLRAPRFVTVAALVAHHAGVDVAAVTRSAAPGDGADRADATVELRG